MRKLLFLFTFSLLLLFSFVSANDSKTLGKSDAPVTIDFYADFECPYCADWYINIFPKIRESYIDSGEVKLVVHHFPLVLGAQSFHTNSLNASIAAECAANQDKFFEYIELLFKNQKALKYENLKEYASKIDLNIEEFVSCYNNDKIKKVVKEEFIQGDNNGVKGTPTFFLDGMETMIVRNYDNFKAYLKGESDELETSPKCIDSDGGLEFFIKGKVSNYNNGKETNLQDYCFENDKNNDPNTDNAYTEEESNSLIFDNIKEYYCEGSEIKEKIKKCSNGCQNGVCIKGGNIKESVTCYFQNSKTDQKCYASYNFDDSNEDGKYCKGIESCTLDFSAEKEAKITWKSSCGGYQYTIQDGNNEKIVFECSGGETNESTILNNGYKNAFWQCYNGKEWKSEGKDCKSAQIWKEKAINFCNGQCKEEKCGVNSFSIGEECYSEDESTLCKDQDVQKCCAKSAELSGTITPTCVGKWIIDDNKCEYKCSSTSQEEIPLICKDSCALEGKCYPFGYRKSDKYCSDESAFINQLEGDKTCENNFECSSNLCVSGKCVSESTIEKILNWFKRIFS